jgi:hypothetical protein
MTRQRLMYATGLIAVLAVALVSTSYGDVVGSFEGKLDGWRAGDGMTLSYSATGATAGAQALQVDGPGGWHIDALLDAKPHRATLANKGVTITADVTAVDADMTTPWMQVEMVINAENEDNNGANNNVGWNSLGAQDVLRDGQPHTYTWVLPDALTGKIAGADDNISWFELVLVTNLDGASVTTFYIDNIQIVGVPVDTGKSTDTVIGNFEQSMDGWAVGGDADVLYNDVNGVTLGHYSLDVWVPTGAWAGVLTMNLLDPNNAAVLDAFRVNTKISADITQLVADWPVDDIPGWNGKHMIINCGGDGWSGWWDLGYQAGWTRNDGDRTITATWGYSQYLSQIQFDNLWWFSLELTVNANDPGYAGPVWFYVDNIRLSGGGIALNPTPANGATDVNSKTLLSWTAGAQAISHNVYLGTSSGAVAGADGDSDPSVTFVQLDGTRFDPNGLDFGTKYFWRVDAINDVNPDSPWKGPVWNFTTGNFWVVDDFESYTNDSPNRVFQVWIDGYGFSEDEFFPGGNAGNGSDSAVGHDIWSPFTQHPTIMETTTVHSGSQAMPLYYDNKGAGYSEATRTWAQPQDWTINGFNAMTLYIYGKADNAADPLYVRVEDSAGKTATVAYNDPAIFTAEAWTEWTISLADFTDVNMAAVTKMAVGIGSRTAVSKAAGMLLIDDIRIGVKPVGLVAYYKLDGNLLDSSGNGHDGTFAGDPNFPAKYVAGPAGLGQALLFDGTGGHQNVELGTFNPSAVTGKLTVALWAKWDGPTDQWQGLIGKRDGWALNDMMWHLEVNRDTGTIGFARYDSYPSSGGATLPIGVWTHVAVTFDGTTARFYINGAETGSGGFSFGDDKESALHFGSDDPNGGNAFNGALDDIRLYDIVLSEAEIEQLAGK